MSESTHHATHPVIVKRLKRANGHLASVIRMIEDAQLCGDITQQLHAVEKAVQIGKASGAWGLDGKANESQKGFLLNHVISAELPPCEAGKNM